MSETGANATRANVPGKLRCSTCQRPTFYFDTRGLQHKCRFCKGMTMYTWEEVLDLYHVLHPGTDGAAFFLPASHEPHHP
jgi:hypothetical protein